MGEEGDSTYEASPSFASCYALATAKSRPSPKPSPTPLHVKGGDATLLMQSVAGFKFAFSRCWSRRIKFEAGSYKFNFKFEHKAIRRRIFVLDEALLNLATGVTSSVMTEPNLKATKYRAKRQAS